MSVPNPTQRGLDPILGVPLAPVEVLDHTRRTGLYIQGSDTFPWGSGLTVDTLEYIIFSSHVAAPEPSTWRNAPALNSKMRRGLSVLPIC